jgi:hypothetical protein
LVDTASIICQALVHGIYNAEEALQYVSYSNDVVAAVKSHLADIGVDNFGKERVVKVRVAAFANKAGPSLSPFSSWHVPAGTLSLAPDCLKPVEHPIPLVPQRHSSAGERKLM